ncbi:VWA domain-containing protein [Thauera sedimentorum]|uniref:VWA domain-containing protein n=1 Tax=Thauera sedimentorum TaxID=2767595 RepID=UPI0032E7F61B
MDWARTLAAKGPAALARSHLRHRPPPAGAATLHCLLLDCSASMLRGRRLALAKGLLLAWTAALYHRREALAVIGFAGGAARVLQPPRKAVAFNERWIAAIAGGGGTPAAAAVALADRLLAQRRRRAPDERVALWLLSDARFATLPPPPRHADQCTVIDFDEGPRALGRAQRLAREWNADCVSACSLAASCGP